MLGRIIQIRCGVRATDWLFRPPPQNSDMLVTTLMHFRVSGVITEVALPAAAVFETDTRSSASQLDTTETSYFAELEITSVRRPGLLAVRQPRPVVVVFFFFCFLYARTVLMLDCPCACVLQGD